MKREISHREMILLGILIILAFYYFVVQGPISQQKKELEAEIETAQSQITALTPVVSQKKAWEKEIEAVYEKYDGDPQSIPDYNNINPVIIEMHAIFDDADSFQLNFSDPQIENHIVTRIISISFTSSSYEDAKNRIQLVHDSKNKYQITDMTMSEGSNGSYSVSLVVHAYEYCESGVLN